MDLIRIKLITFAATNRLGIRSCFSRPGRFDRKILMGTTLKDRKSLFEFYLNKLTLNKEIIENVHNFQVN